MWHVSSQLFGAEEVFDFYYGAMVFSNLMTQMQVRKSYGDGVMSVIVKNFFALAFKTLETLPAHREKKESRSIMPAESLCAISHRLSLPSRRQLHGSSTSQETTGGQRIFCADVTSRQLVRTKTLSDNFN